MSAQCLVRQRKYIIIAIAIFIFIAAYHHLASFNRIISFLKNVPTSEIVDFTDANNVTGFDYPIVPNIVHFVQMDKREISFIQAINIKAAYLNQQPDKIIIHCDCYSLSGKYWDLVKNIPVLEVRYMQRPTHIFGKQLSSVFHASDIARLKVLMEEGGIFLDGDSYVVKSLNNYRKFEMTLGWPPGQNLGTQILVAHKNARFLKLWYNSYKDYHGERWYYNAGELPTTLFLEPNPGLIHRVAYDFGVHSLIDFLYGVKSNDWQNYNCIHLLARHRIFHFPDDPIKEFDEENIKHYNKTFGDMARHVLYGTTDFVD